MGFKAWLARNTSNPAQYADSFAGGLPELSEQFAASLVAFSGQRPRANYPFVGRSTEVQQIAFSDHFNMEQAGFEPVTKDIATLMAPAPSVMSREALFNRAYQGAAAFLCLYSDDAARTNFRPENAAQFAAAFPSSLAKRCAGQYGFPMEPRLAFDAIRALVPQFQCARLLNQQAYGVDDGLCNILRFLSVSADGKMQYAFVVGSKSQPVGCTALYLEVINCITETIQRAARELGW